MFFVFFHSKVVVFDENSRSTGRPSALHTHHEINSTLYELPDEVRAFNRHSSATVMFTDGFSKQNAREFGSDVDR